MLKKIALLMIVFHVLSMLNHLDLFTVRFHSAAFSAKG